MDSLPSDPIWELAEFSVKEAYAMRSFLEYLRTWDDSPDKKLARIQNWKQEIGFQMGNPAIAEKARELFQSLQNSDPETRRVLVQRVLADADAIYLGWK